MSAALLAALLPLAVPAQQLEIDNRFRRDVPRPVLDFSGVQANLAQGPTRVLVLGSTHLRAKQDTIPLEHLSLLLDRLEAWGPDLIATEDTVGRHCDVLELYAPLYEGVAERYCLDTDPAAKALGLDRAEATVAALAMLDQWPTQPEAADRRKLAGLFYAAGDDSSAVLQWLQLAEAERVADDNLPAVLVEKLEARAAVHNESVAIGAVLGARLGHRRLYPMDDRSADVVLNRAPPEAGPTVQRVWDADWNGEAEIRAAQDALLGSPEGLLRYYRSLNSKKAQQNVLDSDFATVAAQPDGHGAARVYTAWWQARGLRMAANVMEATANHPGAKVLVIVGASHKAYFEAYLDAMHDVELVRVADVLTDQPAPSTGAP